MTNTINNGSKPKTFDEAEELGVHNLAAFWADRMSWPMSAVRPELTSWSKSSAYQPWLAGWIGGRRSRFTERSWPVLTRGGRRRAGRHRLRTPTHAGVLRRLSNERLQRRVRQTRHHG